MGLQRIKKYFFGLLIATISDIDIRFCNRINFIRIQFTHRGYKIGMEHTVIGVYMPTASMPKNRTGISLRFNTLRLRSVAVLVSALPAQ